MSQQNVEVVRRCYGLWADRDFSRVHELAEPGIVIDVSRNVFNPGVFRGLDGLRVFVERVDEVWDDFRFVPEEFFDAGDHVVVTGQVSGKGRDSGVEASMGHVAVWTLRTGKVVRCVGGYRDRAEALEAVGLGE